MIHTFFFVFEDLVGFCGIARTGGLDGF